MSNISDHDIRMDNVALKDFASVEASDGTAATMNKAAIKDWGPEKLKQAPAGFQGCCTNTVKPRQALCGGIGVGVLYDLSRPGAYRVRIDRYDEPTRCRDKSWRAALGSFKLVDDLRALSAEF
jgi:hypothetical protein